MTLAVVLAAGALGGCAAEPEPAQPTPLFTSEADAFAAAEETYRAYVDALNRVDLSDPATFEDVYAWTAGDANAGARESFSQMHADGWTVSGPTVIALVQPQSTSSGWREVTLDVCLDVSDVDLVDSAGNSVVSADRRDVQAMLVTMTAAASSPTRFLIGKIDGREGSPECDA